MSKSFFARCFLFWRPILGGLLFSGRHWLGAEHMIHIKCHGMSVFSIPTRQGWQESMMMTIRDPKLTAGE